MRYFITNKTKAFFAALGLILCLTITSAAQTITINSTYTENDEIFPFGTTGTVYGLKISGDVELNSDTSLVRVIMYDASFNEYLVYEAYPYISDDQFSISNICDETCFSDGFVPYSLEIQIVDGELELTTITMASTQASDATTQQEDHKISWELNKVVEIRDKIEQHDMIWFADTNSISNLSYPEKKSLFGDNYNMCGLDYYVGGIFDREPNSVGQTDNSLLIPHFDWRNRHGANDPTKNDFYYSGNENGKQGWMTRVKNQEAYSCKGLCYIYGPLSAMEAVANLYFNKMPHMDYDLSVQQVLDCDSHTTNQCVYGYASITNDFAETRPNGIYQEEGCYYRSGSPNSQCLEGSYNNTAYMFAITGTETISYPQADPPDNIKESLINDGPLCSFMPDFYGPNENHFMVLVGYGVVAEGDRFYDSNGNQLSVSATNSSIGELYWIYKNSMGTEHGANGYLYLLESSYKPLFCYYYQTPIIDKKLSNQVVPDCVDKDNDGYYNWGIGDAPQGWPPENKPDSDDSDSRTGPFDDNYFGIPVAPNMEITYEFNNSTPVTIEEDEFVTFISNDDIEFVITIKNEGSAQLNFYNPNLPPPTDPVVSSNPDVFIIDGTIAPFIEKEIGVTSFKIQYDIDAGSGIGQDMAVIKIHTLEPEYGDFEFVIANFVCPETPGSPIYVSGTVQPWNECGIITGDVYVQKDAELIIQGKYGFIEGVDIFVEKGGRLIIDGGVLSNACNPSWEGLDVWGDLNLSQFVSSNHGYLEILNGAIISDAEVAIEVAHMILGYPVLGSTGGIVKCTEASFIDNTKDVVFYPFENTHPITEEKELNISFFFNTEFINTNENPNAKVSLVGVDGVSFKGCSFLNESYPILPSYPKSIGISSYNSGFYVDDYCLSQYLPCNSSKQSVFSNLKYGIFAINSMNSKFISIDTTVFINNESGIHMSAVDNQSVIRNQFVFDDSHNLTGDVVGLYLENCSGYSIEENIFSSDVHDITTMGIQILNSGQTYNEIYNNTFNSLNTAISAAGENRDVNGNGLCIKCNDFKRCVADINVDPDGSTGDTKGIAYLQGDLGSSAPTGVNPNTMGAGNTFSEINNNDDFNYINDDCTLIKYTHQNYVTGDEVKLRPDPVSINVSRQNDIQFYYSKELSCPSNLVSTIIDESIEKSTLLTELLEIVAYNDTLELLTDGGDTESLNSDITFSLPDEAMELRQQLMDESPYLSDIAMKTAINKESVLPNAMIRDILVANPQSAKAPDVIEQIDNRFDPMPGYLMVDIMAGQDITGASEILEQQLVFHKKLRDQSLNKLEDHYLQDTLNPSESYDSLIALYINEPFKETKYKLALRFLDNGDCVSAFNVLYNIPIDYDLTSYEETTHDDYETLFGVLEQLHCDSILLDSTMVLFLQTISDKANQPGIYARNILINDSLSSYSEVLYFPDVYKSQQTWEMNQTVEKEKSNLRVFPNPAGHYFVVEYNCDELFGSKMIQISDIIGHNLITKKVINDKGQILFSTHQLKPGSYIVKLLINNNLIDSRKVIVSK